jgi:predicted Zn-dependent protease
MIRVADGIQIWVEDMLVYRDRMAGLEDELAERLALRLGSAGSGEAAKAQRSASGEGLTIRAVARGEGVDGTASDGERRKAYEIYQRAHYEWQNLKRHQMQDGLQHLLRATELDPTLTGARVDLVNLCVMQGFYGFMAPTAAADIVRRTAGTTPNLTEGAEAILPALGWVQFHVDRNLPAALSAMARSAHLPHGPSITRARSMFALSRQRFGEAIEILREAIVLDPYSPGLRARLGCALHLAGERTKSLEECVRALERFPEDEGAQLYGTVILAYNGETRRAAELAQGLAQRLPYFDLATAVRAYALACAGQKDEARTILERLQWLGRERFMMRAFMPEAYLAVDAPDEALAALRAANTARCPWFFEMLADPCLKALDGQPEFEEMKAILPAMEAEAAGGADSTP